MCAPGADTDSTLGSEFNSPLAHHPETHGGRPSPWLGLPAEFSAVELSAR